MLDKNKLTMVDLFCGAGIGAVGFKKSGIEIIDAIDNKQYAVDTYNLNIGNHARVADIKKVKSKDIPFADIYVGGIPCQPFSEAGKGEGENHKTLGNLSYEFYRIVKENRPNAFVIENVNGMTNKKHKPFLDKLIKMFEDIDYLVNWKNINCYHYGIPQERKRLFIIGINKNINNKFEFPEPCSIEQRKNLRDAIGDLPDPSVECVFKNHSDYYKGGFSSRYTSRNRQRQWDEPSFTIVSTARQLPLHPNPPNYDIRKMDEYKYDPPRRFTVRECLRIQSVPDWFYYEESIPLDKQYERCSGIPSDFAYLLGNQLKKCLFET